MGLFLLGQVLLYFPLCDTQEVVTFTGLGVPLPLEMVLIRTRRLGGENALTSENMHMTALCVRVAAVHMYPNKRPGVIQKRACACASTGVPCSYETPPS